MSTADEIEKLAQLREQGALSDEEFEQEKRAILARGAGPPAGAPAPGPTPAPPQPTKTSGLAILAIVLAVLFFIPVVPLIGAILGIAAVVRLRTRPHLSGRGAAIGAIIAGFVITFVIQGMMGAVAIPAFIKYTRKAKTIEATEGLDMMRAGAKQYFQADHYDEQTGNIQPKRFPPSSGGWTPAAGCCEQGGKCLPDAAAWGGSPWVDLHFQLSDPHYYQWRFVSAGTNQAATATLEARGDLDCDGVYSTYQVLLSVDEEYGVVSKGPIIFNEIE